MSNYSCDRTYEGTRPAVPGRQPVIRKPWERASPTSARRAARRVKRFLLAISVRVPFDVAGDAIGANVTMLTIVLAASAVYGSPRHPYTQRLLAAANLRPRRRPGDQRAREVVPIHSARPL
jgi:hypothetical protein